MDQPPQVQPALLNAQGLDPSDIGSPEWDREFNAERLTLTDDGRTVEWDPRKQPAGEDLPPVWMPARTRLRLHSGSFRWDFVVEQMGKAQIGVGFMLLWNLGVDWGFHGYLGASATAWAYDPSTGDVVQKTKSIEGGLRKFPMLPNSKDRSGGVVRVVLDLPRRAEGRGRFVVDGVSSRPIPLPAGAVVLPAACMLQLGQRVTLDGFARTGEGESGVSGGATY